MYTYKHHFIGVILIVSFMTNFLWADRSKEDIAMDLIHQEGLNIFNESEPKKSDLSLEEKMEEAYAAYKSKNYSQALLLLKPLVEVKHPKAMNILGIMYEKGNGVVQDKSKAKEFYTEACDGGIVESCHKLGLIYIRENDIGKNKAKELFEKACNGGIIGSCHNLGFMYFEGKGVKKDINKAKNMYEKACDGGMVESCHKLGFMYYTGKNMNKAKIFFIKACDGGIPSSCHNLGLMYYKGQGIRKDVNKAKIFFKKSCDGGISDGCHNFKL